jgi:hypothetical protein
MQQSRPPFSTDAEALQALGEYLRASVNRITRYKPEPGPIIRPGFESGSDDATNQDDDGLPF